MFSPGQETTERVLGINFFNGSAADAVAALGRTGGYAVIPASPALMKLRYDEEYRRALQSADLALADSGWLVLLWKLFTGRKLRPVSGISYLRELLRQGAASAGQSTFWVFGSATAKQKASRWLAEHGFPVEERLCFAASFPPSSEQDYAILVKIEEEKPNEIVIAVTGGNQERLALYLRDYLLYRPRIHCIGAALAFLSGEEKAIPGWAERRHLGWLVRLVAQPKMLFPRLGIAFALAGMIYKYRSELPPLKKRWADM